MKKIFIIILNFNGGKDTAQCLESIGKLQITCLAGRRANYKLQIIVVDNGSRDGSINQIKNLKLKMKNDKLKLKIIENHKNLGFAAGCNVGIKYALGHNADVVLLLNPDTTVPKGFLKPLLENPADIVGPVIKFKRDGRWVYDFGGKVNWWIGRTTHSKSIHPQGTLFANSSTSEEPLRVTVRGVSLVRISAIDYVSGCAMLIKRPVFEKIGLLDEKYFLYFEDVDFCLRAQNAGFKVAVESRSIILHKLLEGKKKPLSQHFSHLKSNFIFINRWVTGWRKPLAYIYLLVLLFKVLTERL